MSTAVASTPGRRPQVSALGCQAHLHGPRHGTLAGSIRSKFGKRFVCAGIRATAHPRRSSGTMWPKLAPLRGRGASSRVSPLRPRHQQRSLARPACTHVRALWQHVAQLAHLHVARSCVRSLLPSTAASLCEAKKITARPQGALSVPPPLLEARPRPSRGVSDSHLFVLGVCYMRVHVDAITQSRTRAPPRPAAESLDLEIHYPHIKLCVSR